MKSRYSPASILCLLLAAFAVGCTAPATVTKSPTEKPMIDPNQQKIDRIVDWLELWSSQARSIEAEGGMTVSNAETQQSGNFTLKTKRLRPVEGVAGATSRIDSVSLEVRGPFGITGIRFLASPQWYALYNALMGETMEGPTSAAALEGLTQLRGISLQTMNDVIFGLPPSPDDIDPQDSIVLLSRGATQHILLVYRFRDNYTEALTLDGAIPEGDQPLLIDQLRLIRYDRWSGMMMNYGATNPKTQATIRYNDIVLKNNIPFANQLDISTGENRLQMEFEEVQYNPQDLRVYINIPGRKR